MQKRRSSPHSRRSLSRRSRSRSTSRSRSPRRDNKETNLLLKSNDSSTRKHPRDEKWNHDRYKSESAASSESDDENSRTKKPRESRDRTRQREPNRDVVLQGLLPTTLDQRLQQRLEQLNASIESVRVIREKTTGQSRGFAFARFVSIEHSQQWVEEHPFITVDGTRVRVDYSNHTSSAEEDWICPKCYTDNFKRRARCYQCGVDRPDPQTVGPYVNDGSRDASDIPNSVLLLRGLNPLTDEEKIYNRLQSLDVKSVRIIRDRLTNVSWGFAFAEFPNVQVAARALSTLLQQAFILDEVVVGVTYSHINSFVQTPGIAEFATATYMQPGGVVSVMYWDQQAYGVEYPKVSQGDAAAVGTSQEALLASAAVVASKPAKKKKERASVEDELAAFYDNVAKESAAIAESNQGANALSEHDDSELTAAQLAEKGRKAAAASKKVQEQLAKWQTRQVEFGGAAEDEGDDEHVQEPLDLSDEALLKRLPTDEQVNEEHQNLELVACLLCERQFNDPNTLRKHQVKSDLHKTNLQNLRKVQMEELREKLQSEQQQYRNRAAERRQLHNQPKKPRFSHSNNPFKRDRPIEPEQPTKFGINSDNIGSKMLKAMGWKEGEGLGKNKSGIVNPIEGQMYARGAGLGAAPGVPASSVDDSYSGRVSRMTTRF
ncbi:hypothetical protein BJ742DRAFT_816741 [Cladochytrium replicatum]|nr:hypothetical protein BJ742DRAFT_816741 [Cladochytrium replicatum]